MCVCVCVCVGRRSVAVLVLICFFVLFRKRFWQYCVSSVILYARLRVINKVLLLIRRPFVRPRIIFRLCDLQLQLKIKLYYQVAVLFPKEYFVMPKTRTTDNGVFVRLEMTLCG